MTNEIQRYSMGGHDWEVEINNNGDWVEYEDHERIVAELKQEILNLSFDVADLLQDDIKGMC